MKYKLQLTKSTDVIMRRALVEYIMHMNAMLHDPEYQLRHLEESRAGLRRLRPLKEASVDGC